MAVRSVVCPVHVGREEELAALRTTVTSVRSGGRTTLIGGDAGVGKSRLSNEAVRLAEAEGMLVLPGACSEGASAAYAPVVAALRRHTRRLDTGALRELFDGPARLAATLLPELAETLELGDLGANIAPEHLHAAAWQLFTRLGAERPVLLLLEDLHWADLDTLRLVAHLVAEAPTLPLWLVVTYRLDELHRRHPLTPVLARIRRAGSVEEIRLAALGREELRVMISALFGDTEVGDEFLDTILERTAGNPFFVEELCAVLVERGDIYERDGDFHRRNLTDMELPETVRETLLARLGRLEREDVELLQLAAVAGERVDPRVIAQAAGVGDDAVDRAMVSALDHHLLTERRDAGAPTYAFRHALTREALAEDLIGPERRRAHRRIAEALATVWADDVDTVAAELSEHHGEAGDVAKAAEYALRAARRAVAQHAPAVAAAQFGRALRLIPDEAEDRPSVLVEAAEATFTDQDRGTSAASPGRLGLLPRAAEIPSARPKRCAGCGRTAGARVTAREPGRLRPRRSAWSPGATTGSRPGRCMRGLGI
jgi:predicted ATPase